MSRLLFSLSVIVFGLVLGYVIQKLVRRGLVTLLIPIDTLRRLLQEGALLVVNPLAIMSAIWAIPLRDISLAVLPFIGLFALLLGGVFALAAAKLMRLPRRKAGAMFGCGSFTNIGSIGGLVCFVFLGEAGFGLVPMYKILEEFAYYGIGFPIAKHYGHGGAAQESRWAQLRRLAGDRFVLTALASIFLGALLSISNVPRPAAFTRINAVLVPLGTVMLLTSIGLAMRFGRVRDYLKESTAVSLIKFVLVPAATSSLAWWFGLGEIHDGLPLKVVIILSSMPVAFTALIPPSLYDLDLDLANSCWFVTTFLMVAVLPLLLVVLNLF